MSELGLRAAERLGEDVAGPLSTAFLGQFNPEAVGRARGGASGLSVLDGVLVDVFRLITDDVSVFMAFVLLLNVVGVAALGVALLLLARRRAWLVAVFASPVILFTLGSTLDPLALALSLWAVVLVVAPAPVTPRPWLAGILLAIAAFENPLALLVLAALALSGLYPPGRLEHRNPQMMIATATIASAIILVADGTTIRRVTQWLSDAVDGGSFASILVMARIGDAGTWATVWIVASGLLVAGVLVALFMVRVHGLDPAVTSCLLIGSCLVLAPALMPWDSLWLLPSSPSPCPGGGCSLPGPSPRRSSPLRSNSATSPASIRARASNPPSSPSSPSCGSSPSSSSSSSLGRTSTGVGCADGRARGSGRQSQPPAMPIPRARAPAPTSRPAGMMERPAAVPGRPPKETQADTGTRAPPRRGNDPAPVAKGTGNRHDSRRRGPVE